MQEIIIFYAYTRIADPAGFVRWQRAVCQELGLTGRILVAQEGINGTAEGTSEAIAEYERRMHAQDGSAGTFGNFSHVWFKHSPGTGNAFPSLKVKVRKEIVTLGLGDHNIDPNTKTGVHISAKILKSWVESGEDFEIIDMRNDYEYHVGHFKNSKHLQLENFRDLRERTKQLSPFKNKKVLTVCTYGVRCEKASGYLREQGFEEVYQLDGGIGTYMKEYPGEDFLGSLYVFDNRMLERPSTPHQVVGTCAVCQSKSENFTNCAVHDCHKKMIVCEGCLTHTTPYCSEACKTQKK